MIEKLYDRTPAVSVEKIRKARKDYRCLECKRQIHRGDRYSALNGFYTIDGTTKTQSINQKTCLTCENIKMYLLEKYEIDPAFGELWETIDELY